MKYLGAPAYDDFLIINELSERKALSSYPLLRDEKDNIASQYLTYHLAKGNAFELSEPLKLSKQLTAALKTHYSTEPSGLEFISVIRKTASPDVCPMCGSLGTSEVDHVIPKDVYPEYSFFSRNLVPACDCNGKKGVALKGTTSQARILHPYFDEILSYRLAYIGISGNLNTPKLSIEIIPEHSNKASVKYHISQVLEKTNVLSWAAKTWASILRAPNSYFQALAYIHGEISTETLRQLISAKLASDYVLYQTPNSWPGMFLFGMQMNPDVAEFLSLQIDGIRKGTLCPT